jgi:D-tagatose-1,6-bisphosphate aldolase subunit GatZ/KbaZ
MSVALQTNPLGETIRRHKAGEPVGIYSVCSAHPTVVQAAIEQADADGSYVLIEATSNQVDQFGGYTGLRPAGFRDLVLGIADQSGFARERVVLGGDHLGPNRWQRETASAAMDKADVLIASYVEAGYSKIHLDCSMSCADDPTVLPDETVAARTARLLRVAEDTAHRVGIDAPVYVIGTEVPVPGGAHETLHQLTPTPADRARRTIATHRAAFAKLQLDHVWPRVAALVVQPGVEFDHQAVFDYQRDATVELRRVLDTEDNLVFEAHSTDYQRPAQLRELVEDHWAILKVGPALTFAMREALFALAHIESELVAEPSRSNLIDVIERCMLDDPTHCPQVQLQRPAALLLGRRRDRCRTPDTAGQPRPHGHTFALDQPIPADPVQPDTHRQARIHRAVAGRRPGTRRPKPLRPRMPHYWRGR